LRERGIGIVHANSGTVTERELSALGSTVSQPLGFGVQPVSDSRAIVVTLAVGESAGPR
jgi:hypothetical protein